MVAFTSSLYCKIKSLKVLYLSSSTKYDGNKKCNECKAILKWVIPKLSYDGKEKLVIKSVDLCCVFVMDNLTHTFIYVIYIHIYRENIYTYITYDIYIT